MNQKGMIKIFDIEGGKLELSPECYTEPYLKNILDAYEDPVPALCYVYYNTYPWSMYNNFREEERESAIYNTYPGEYTRDDLVIVEAIRELKKRYETPLQRFYESQRNLLDVISKYNAGIKTTDVDSDGMRGNLKVFKDQLKDSKNTAAAFLELENLYKEQLQTKLSGGLEAAYDEDFID